MPNQIFLKIAFLFFVCVFSVNIAQAQTRTADVISGVMYAEDAVHLKHNDKKIKLWGVETVSEAEAAVIVKGRTALDNAIRGGEVICETKSKNKNLIVAQCENSERIDLGLLMLQQGHAIVQRTIVTGSVFEGAYVEAEARAQAEEAGMWRVNSSDPERSLHQEAGLDQNLLFGIITINVLGFLFIAIIIRGGFRKLYAAYERAENHKTMASELESKEKEILSATVEREMLSNKSKIEAYLVVYEEMLETMNNHDIEPKYTKAGDIIQKQPALERDVYDVHYDQIQTLPEDIRTPLNDFYENIQTEAEYETLEPDTPREQAHQLLEKVVSHARALHVMSENIMNGLGK